MSPQPLSLTLKFAHKAKVDLTTTFTCGQSFVWTPQNDGSWKGYIDAFPTQIRQLNHNTFIIRTSAPREVVEDYFQAHQDWDKMVATFPSDDRVLKAALDYAGGMILLRQPLWETIASFILSSQKQIPHISTLVSRLRQHLGQPISPKHFSFPTPETLAQTSESELRALGLGFRAKSLRIAAQQIASGELDLRSLALLPYNQAHQRLQLLRGVGPKIADCICLFALGHYVAFPLDTWILRLVRKIYLPRKQKLSPEAIQKFAASHFGPYAGYAQQILFHWIRHHWRNTHLKSPSNQKTFASKNSVR
ncbi:MAG: hypothetical protein NZM04_08200 [Methylacidiphilales bacterium]|nr:hypothetical protein [Candidatus Methylacidiphilales bacterium]MDW8349028.1 DNA glycosylase [Verrucomicrobiae bacterium]